MNLADQGLLRHIIIAILVKIVLITALWWAFVRDAKVAVDPAAMAAQISAPVLSNPLSSKQNSPAGETHGQ